MAQEEKIFEVLLDPAWKFGTITLAGVSMPRVTLVHPRLGEINCVVPKETVEQLIAGLKKVIET